MRRPSYENCSSLLKELVQVDTRQPEGNESKLVELIRDKFLRYNVETRVFDHGNNRSSLIVKLPGKQPSGGLGFFMHLDTVAFGDVSSWKYDPLSCHKEDDTFYGRGVADMKGGAVSALEAAFCLLDNNIELQKPVYLCFTADEEAGGIGILSMLDDAWIKGLEEAIICEPTNDQIGISEKGALWLRAKIVGVQAHGSRPEIAVNAVEYAIAFQERLRGCIEQATTHPYLGKTTMAVTKLHGGIMTNIIPGEAEIEMDIRSTPDIDHSLLLKKAEEIIKDLESSAKGLAITLSVKNNRPAVETKEDHSFIQKMQGIASAHSIDSKCRGLMYYTDASQLIPPLGIPFVIYGPGDDKQAHQINEHLQGSSLLIMSEVYYDYICQHLCSLSK